MRQVAHSCWSTREDDYKTPKSPLIRQVTDGHHKLWLRRKSSRIQTQRRQEFSHLFILTWKHLWDFLKREIRADRCAIHRPLVNCEWPFHCLVPSRKNLHSICATIGSPNHPATGCPIWVQPSESIRWSPRSFLLSYPPHKANTEEFQQRMKEEVHTQYWGLWQIGVYRPWHFHFHSTWFSNNFLFGGGGLPLFFLSSGNSVVLVAVTVAAIKTCATTQQPD